MPQLPLERRVELLKENVDSLSQLPARVGMVETQILALRDDVTSFRAEMRVELTGIHGDIAGIRGEFALVRDEIRAGDEETRRQMRILHEEVISRIALLDYAWRGRM